MRTGVYICTCNSTLSGTLDMDFISLSLKDLPDVFSVKTFSMICSADGASLLAEDIRAMKPERIVFASCSPRTHEQVFHKVLEDAGMNPYLMQVANIREQVAWVTPNPAMATRKALALIWAAVARVRHHQPIEKTAVPVCTDVMIIGAGPAGLSAAQLLTESGRNVVLVEKAPSPGGMPMRYERLFPDESCGPCLMQPALDALLHGENPGAAELLTLAAVRSIRGSYGKYEITVEQLPRYIDTALCVGCGECVNACPVSIPASVHSGEAKRKAVDFALPGALPHVPCIDMRACLRRKGKDCSACRNVCPVPGTIRFDDTARLHRRTVGAVVLATGASLFDSTALPDLGVGKVPDVITSLSFERMMSSDGPTNGKIRMKSGRAPSRIAIVHCVGSLDERYKPYCSSVCCRYALKYRAMIRERLPEAKIMHFIKEWCLPGPSALRLYRQAHNDRNTKVMRYHSLSAMHISGSGAVKKISFEDDAGRVRRISVDMAVLCPAIVPAVDSSILAGTVGIKTDEFGFLRDDMGDETANRGVYSAGTCRAPVDIGTAMEQGRAAAGRILAGLREGAVIEVLPTGVQVDPVHCSGCMLCIQLCPAKAIEPNPGGKKAFVRELHCTGCGICIGSCPSGALHGGNYSSAALSAEMKGALDRRDE